MTATTTKDRPATVGDLLQPKPASIDIDAHEAELTRLRAEQEEKAPVLEACLDPAVAKWYEDQKEVFVWRVEAVWRETDSTGSRKPFIVDEKVVAQNAADAWAMVCDSIEQWPSRRSVKPKITQVKKLPRSAAGSAPPPTNDDDTVTPTRLRPKKRAGRL
jgi:hypothetical protein